MIIATRDRPEFVATFWGAIKAGLVPVPVAPMLSASRSALHPHRQRGARARVRRDLGDRGDRRAVEGTSVVCLLAEPDGRSRGRRIWAEVCGRPATLEPAPTTEDDIALWLYTSGTTGLPEGRDAPPPPPQGGARLRLARQVLGMEADDVVLSVSRMFFAYGLGNSVYLPAAVGASVVVSETPGASPRW